MYGLMKRKGNRMDAVQHYNEAETLLTLADTLTPGEEKTDIVAEAAVHASLANASGSVQSVQAIRTGMAQQIYDAVGAMTAPSGTPDYTAGWSDTIQDVLNLLLELGAGG